MGVLSRVRRMFGSGKSAAPAIPDDHECLHGTLMGRWERPADMGDDSKATAFVCSACNESFSPQEATEVRRRAVERLRL